MDNIKALEARVENLEATLKELCIALHGYHQERMFIQGRMLSAERGRYELLEASEREHANAMLPLYNIVTKQEK